MQTASGQTVKERRRVARVRRGPSWAAILVTLFVGLISVGVLIALLVAILTGNWPPESGPHASYTPTPFGAAANTPYLSGLKVEAVGEPQRHPQYQDQVSLRVRVTNEVKMPPNLGSAEETEGPTPVPQEANILHAVIKVEYYLSGRIVATGLGNVGDLPYGQTEEIVIEATPVNEFDNYEVKPDSMNTDLDPTGTPEPGGTPNASP